MSLRVWIGGPRFGESIVISWSDAEGRTVAAVIDSHAQLAEWRLKDLGFPAVRFVAATHPHYDHIENLAEVMIGERPDKVHWWGDDSVTHEKLCHRLIDKLVHPDSTAANHCRAFFSAAKLSGHARLAMTEPGDLMYDTTDQTGTKLSIWALGPWPESRHAYLKSFHGQFPGTGVKRASVAANRTSLGLLVTYGDAQAVLGGDMEKPNWEALKQGWGIVQQRATANGRPVPPDIAPALVKVSHHGSNTGHTEGMWPEGQGWFGNGAKPWCVVTPWCFPAAGENVSRTLPDKDTLNMLHASGCKVMLTGTPNDKLKLTLAEVEACMVLNESFVEFELLAQGAVRVVKRDRVQQLTEETRGHQRLQPPVSF